MGYELDLAELLWIDDALDFMARNYSLADHVSCYKAEKKDAALAGWFHAKKILREVKTVRRAQNHVARLIEDCR